MNGTRAHTVYQHLLSWLSFPPLPPPPHSLQPTRGMEQASCGHLSHSSQVLYCIQTDKSTQIALSNLLKCAKKGVLDQCCDISL